MEWNPPPGLSSAMNKATAWQCNMSPSNPVTPFLGTEARTSIARKDR
jgi:hypothetical protein